MRNLPAKQQGASAIVTIIVLALLAYGVYLGLQYVPQAIESRSIDSIFSDNVSARRISGTITLKVKYERELNLGYKTKPMVYEKTLVLR